MISLEVVPFSGQPVRHSQRTHIFFGMDKNIMNAQVHREPCLYVMDGVKLIYNPFKCKVHKLLTTVFKNKKKEDMQQVMRKVSAMYDRTGRFVYGKRQSSIYR